MYYTCIASWLVLVVMVRPELNSDSSSDLMVLAPRLVLFVGGRGASFVASQRQRHQPPPPGPSAPCVPALWISDRDRACANAMPCQPEAARAERDAGGGAGRPLFPSERSGSLVAVAAPLPIGGCCELAQSRRAAAAALVVEAPGTFVFQLPAPAPQWSDVTPHVAPSIELNKSAPPSQPRARDRQ